MNRSESKYFNTAVKMDEALISLLEKKDFEYISIKEICSLAGVNRSTFYLHYETTRDLLAETLEYINAKFETYFDDNEKSTLAKIRAGTREELVFITRENLEPYLNFIKEHERLFAAVLKNPQTFESNRAFGKLSEQLFYPIMDCFAIPERERKYMLMFYIQGIIGIINEWLIDDCRDSVEFVSEMIIKLIMNNNIA